MFKNDHAYFNMKMKTEEAKDFPGNASKDCVGY